jgi:hypothetical protein
VDFKKKLLLKIKKKYFLKNYFRKIHEKFDLFSNEDVTDAHQGSGKKARIKKFSFFTQLFFSLSLSFVIMLLAINLMNLTAQTAFYVVEVLNLKVNGKVFYTFFPRFLLWLQAVYLHTHTIPREMMKEEKKRENSQISSFTFP